MLKRIAKAIFPASWLTSGKLRVHWLFHYVATPRKDLLRFTCNICSKRTSYAKKKMTRELRTCVHCGSTVRFRSIIHTLSMELFGKSLPLKDFPERKDLVGVGMSDWEGYAKGLAGKLTYVNTYYHKEPLLNITSVDASLHEQYDFIIATEVFEHVAQPVSIAFTNAFRLLKRGGVLIFSVPVVEGTTREHFPELYQYKLQEESGSWVLSNETSDGRHQQYCDLTFHGGPGTTLEMRVFGRDSLLENFANQGFQQVRLHDETLEEFGIIWNPYVAEEAPYRPYIYGLDAAPWSARRK